MTLNHVTLNHVRRRRIVRTAVASTVLLAGTAVTGAQAASDADPIVIGMSAGLTGPASAIVEPVVAGIQLHFDEVNAAGGVNGRLLELRAVDDGYDVARAVNNTRQFLADDDVFGLIGFGTAPVGAVTGLTCDQGVAMMFLAAVEATGSCFRTQVTPEGMLIAAGTYLADTHGPEVLERIALYAQNDDYGEFGQRAVEQLAEVYGSEFRVFTVEAGATDASSQAAQIVGFEPTVILAATLSTPNALLLNALEGRNVQIGEGGVFFAGTDTIDARLIDLAGPAAEGVYGATDVLDISDTTNPAIAQFLAAHEAHDPDGLTTTFVLLGYALAQGYVAGLEGAGDDLTPESWVAAMKTVKDLPSTQGPLDFSMENQQGGHTVQITQVVDGVLTFVDSGRSALLD